MAPTPAPSPSSGRAAAAAAAAWHGGRKKWRGRPDDGEVPSRLPPAIARYLCAWGGAENGDTESQGSEGNDTVVESMCRGVCVKWFVAWEGKKRRRCGDDAACRTSSFMHYECQSQALSFLTHSHQHQTPHTRTASSPCLAAPCPAPPANALVFLPSTLSSRFASPSPPPFFTHPTQPAAPARTR